MNSKTIKWRKEFIKMFPKEIERKLSNNHIWCDKCNGIGFIKRSDYDRDYIAFCATCSGRGQIELCQNKCGNSKYRYSSFCQACHKASLELQAQVREGLLFEKAKKVSYKDYGGKFIIGETVKDKDELYEWLYDQICNQEDVPNYIFGTYKTPVMSIDFKDVIDSACEEGYEDMTSFLDYNGVDEIQKMIDAWIEKQGESNYCYYEDTSVAVLLDDLIVELKKEAERM